MNRSIAIRLAAAVGFGAALASSGMLATGVAHSDTVLTYPGWEIPGAPNVMPAQLQGSMCAAPNTCRQVAESYVFMGSFPLPQGVYDPAGQAKLDTAIKAAKTPTVVFGYSAGASIATQVLNSHKGEPANPNVSYVFIGDSNRVGSSDGGKGIFPAVFGDKVGISPDSEAPVTVVTVQYDGWADFPSDPTNVLADINALVGMNTIHPTAYVNVDVNDPKNIVTKRGNVTDVLVPTPTLPMLSILHGLVPDKTIAKWNTKLKPIVDAGYQKPAQAAAANVSKPAATKVKAAADRPHVSKRMAEHKHPIADAVQKITHKLTPHKTHKGTDHV